MPARVFILHIFILLGSVTIKAQSLIMPAEFEKNQGIIMVWPYDDGRDSVLARIAALSTGEGRCQIVVNPLNPDCDSACILQLLMNFGVQTDSISFLRIENEDDRIRDYGPMVGYQYNGEIYDRFLYDAGFSIYNQPLNDTLPSILGSVTGLPAIPLFLELQTGCIVFDGLKSAFGSRSILDLNPGIPEDDLIAQLKNYFKADQFILLPKAEHLGGGGRHPLSLFMKFTDTETVLISQLPENAADFEVLEQIADTIASLVNGFGKPYQVVRIPVPTLNNGAYATSIMDEGRSYTQSLIINKKVLIPSFDQSTDSIAKCIYEDMMPGYEVFQIDSRALSESFSSIHTSAVQIPQQELFRFRHYRISGEQEVQYEIPVSCYPQFNQAMDSILVHYRVHPSDEFITSPLLPACPGYIGTISGFSPGDTVSYYLSAHGSGYSVTEPLTAPQGCYSFHIQPLNTGWKEIEEQDHTFNIYPNPGNGRMVIDIEKSASPNTLFELIDLNGVIIHSTLLTEKKTTINLPISFKNGVYLGRIISADSIRTQKIILQR